MSAEALRAQAGQLFQAGRLAESRAALQALLAQCPGDAATLNALGVVALQLEGGAAALPWFNRSLAALPQQAKALANRALCHLALEKLAAALADFDAALALEPHRADLLADSAALLARLGQPQAAMARYDRALTLAPQNPTATAGRASLLRQLGRAAEAIPLWQALLASQGARPELLANLATAQEAAGQRADAAASWDQAAVATPAPPLARGHAWYLRRQLCDWGAEPAASQALQAALARGEAPLTPFACLSLTDDPALQRRAAEADAALTPQPPPLAAPRGYAHRRLRIAYLSADFRDHALSRLMASTIAAHDRDGFEVLGVALDPPPADDPLRPRIAAACDRFLEAGALDDAAVAAWLRAAETDIAIDLNGATGMGRPGVLARRPAPAQASYLGFPGGSGAPWMDWLLADAIIAPAAERPHYREAVLALPGCFQANEPAGPLPTPPSRVALGLPAEGFVFCCLNAHHKLGPADFALWLGLLAAVPGSVLWLLGGVPGVEANLRAAAVAAGVAPERLCFTGRLPYEQHIARMAAADLFLDTLPFNGGATVSDALRAGLPVLTSPGRAFAGRMAASLLAALGLPELVAPDRTAYAALGMALAQQPARLAALRSRLAEARRSAPLFEPTRIARQLEAAYRRMAEFTAAGLPAASLDLAEAP